LRFTFDSNVLVRAIISPYGPARRLLYIVRTDHILVLSPFILNEVERVLLYPRIRSRYRITAGEAVRLVRDLAKAAHLVEPLILRPIIPSDPADDPVLYTAADGTADIICTRNTKHLSSPEAQAFCAEHGIRVLTELEILDEMFKRPDQ
jgi:uncharacterized protein